MNKTENINIGGQAFIIDADAYQLLEDYMNDLDRYFNNHQDKEEIMSDIEMRMSELLSSRLAHGRSVVSLSDVESGIAALGRPQDFDDSSETQSHSSNTTGRKKLYRDPTDKKIAGVCSGLAAYFGLDSYVVRIIFAVLFFLGFGSTFLVYVLLWAFVPYARNAADRLAMKGEPIDIDHIVRDVEKGVHKLGDALQGIAEKIDKKTMR